MGACNLFLASSCKVDEVALMSDSSIKLINRASLLEQREKLLEALAETEGILKALGWEPEAAAESVPTVKAVRPRRRIRIATPPAKVSLRDAVLEACRDIRENITRGNIVNYLKSKYPEMDVKDASVGATLSNLKSDEEIDEVERGSGGKPSVFRISNTN